MEALIPTVGWAIVLIVAAAFGAAVVALAAELIKDVVRKWNR